MKKYLIFIFFTISLFTLNAQVKLEKTHFDLGEIQLLNDDVIDINLKNTSEEQLFIVMVEPDKNSQIKYTSRVFKTGATETLRVKLNTRKKGEINSTVKLYFGQNKDAINMSFTADVIEVPVNHLQDCPDFSSNKVYAQAGSYKNQKKGEIKSENVGIFKEEQFEEYLAMKKQEERELIAKKREEERIERNRLKELQEQQRQVLAEEERLLSLEEKIQDELSRNNEKEIIEQSTKPSTESEQEIIEKQINPNLLDNSYKPNNIVFLLDASTSMNKEGKMELLKKAMKELLVPLRSTDYIAIVSYAGESSIVMASTPASNKDAISKSIDNIQAEGSTNAVKGIRTALQVANNNFIENGNNQIILATDGAFDIGAKNNRLRNKIESNAKDNILISVIGINNASWTNKSLKEIANLGQGSYLKIKSDRNLSVILDEVKKRSLKSL